MTRMKDKHSDTMISVMGEEVKTYRKTSIISRTLVDNSIVDQSDVVGASPNGAAQVLCFFVF